MNPDDRPKRGRDVQQFLSKHGIRGVYPMCCRGYFRLEGEPTDGWVDDCVYVSFLGDLTYAQWLEAFQAKAASPLNRRSAVSQA